MEEDSHLHLKLVDMVVSPPDRRTPMGEATVDAHLDLMTLTDLGDR